MKKVRFLHILWANDIKFYVSLVDLINNSGSFYCEDHYFITVHTKVADALSEYSNVELVDCPYDFLIHRYAEYADWIFVHALNCIRRTSVVSIPRKVARKVIWRTWGHDIKKPNYSGGKKDIPNRLLQQLYIRKIRQFRAIGVGSDVDRVYLNRFLGEGLPPFFQLPYTSDAELVEKVKKEVASDDGIIRVLVGHSGFLPDNHVSALNYLKKYKDERIEINLLFSYGESDYIKLVSDTARSMFGSDKVRIITDFMDKARFIAYLNSMDVVIFNQEVSTGLGCLFLANSLEKTIYFNRKGVIASSMIENGCEINYVEDIPKMDFNVFYANKTDKKIKKLYSEATKEELIKSWQNVLKMLL